MPVKSDSGEKGSEVKSKTELIADIQKQNSISNTDTAYYKEMFLDLFEGDKEFIGKFPSAGTNNSSSTGGFSTYNRSTYSRKSGKSKDENIEAENKIEKVWVLEPFYLKIDETKEEEVQYVASDKKQEKYSETVNICAKKQNFELITIDPAVISTTDVDKMNDYSVMNDWFAEKFDADDNERNLILNTDDIDNLILKYGTQYVLRTGVVNYKPGRGGKKTYYYAFIFDIKLNKIAYKKYEVFRGNDVKDLINAKVYQTFFDLKHL